MKSRNPGTVKWMASVILMGLVAWGPVQLSRAFEVPDQSLVYEFVYNRHSLGQLEILIERKDPFVKTTAVSHLNAIAKLFQPELIEETLFRIDGDTVRVESGATLSRDGKTVRRSYVIDHPAGVIQFSSGKEVPVEPGDRFESTSFPLGLLASEIGTLDGEPIREINAKRVRTYIYLPPEMETIHIDGVEYNTWKVTRHKHGDTRRTVTAWLDRENHNIPVRITTRKRKSVSVFTLQRGS